VDALTWVFVVAAAASVGAWVASLVSGDTSWVDRMWSILPEVYVWIFAAGDHFGARLTTMAVLTTLWGARLTFNFARKGGYSGVEDYRWRVIRQSMSRRRFQLFNLGFIVIYQNALLVLIALPAWSAARLPSRAIGPLDVALAATFVALLVAETVADQQQWDFHQAKKRRGDRGEVPAPGFLRDGLFRYSRHPNYFFEIAQWWVVFFFAALAARTVALVSALGPVLLTLLFVGSTRFTERISASKYPEYSDYQRDVSAIIPWRPRRATRAASIPTEP
jgi:steroid 5-alpha reductase family enzyme